MLSIKKANHVSMNCTGDKLSESIMNDANENKEGDAMERKLKRTNSNLDSKLENETPKSKKMKLSTVNPVKIATQTLTSKDEKNVKKKCMKRKNTGMVLSDAVDNQQIKKQKLVEESLDCAQIYKKILEGEIVTIKPHKFSKNFEMYTVCRKLKWAKSGKIVRHFFLCTSCETVLNINLTTHHNILKRHSSKCNDACDKNPEQLSIEVVPGEFIPFVYALIKFGSIYGKINLKDVKVPKTINSQSRIAFINNLKMKLLHLPRSD